jgi:polysaccharide export outer membrane protein
MRDFPRAARLPRRIAALAAMTALSACASVSDLPPAPPEPADVGSVAALPPYRIQVGDVLDIRLLLNPELNEEVTVRPDGHISTTVVPDEVALGKTIGELAAALRQDYRHDLQNPRISIIVKSFAPTRIYVGGEVNTPGEFITVGPTLTLSQAVARAGGTKLSSDDAKIFVIRRGPNDQAQMFSTSYEDVKHGRRAAADIRLAPYDVVYVPKSGVAEVYKWYNQYFQQFVNPSVGFGFSYLVNPGNGGSTVITSSTTGR